MSSNIIRHNDIQTDEDDDLLNLGCELHAHSAATADINTNINENTRQCMRQCNAMYVPDGIT